MGHDITGYEIKEVAYYRNSAFNPTNHYLYDMLECSDLSGGVSGIGTYREFERKYIENRVMRYRNLESHKREVEFLDKLLSSEKDSFIIYFG